MKLTSDDIARIHELAADGVGVLRIAKYVGTCRTTVENVLEGRYKPADGLSVRERQRLLNWRPYAAS